MFMLFVYAINRKMIYTRIAKDRHRYVDSYGDILRGMLSTVTPIIMSTFIYNFSTSFNQTVYSKVMIYARGLSLAQTATSYGIFAGKAMVIINIPIALASSLSAAMIPTISASSALGDQTATRRKVINAMWTTMLIAIPSSVGLAVLAKPIMQLLFPQKDSLDMAAKHFGNDRDHGCILFLIDTQQWYFTGDRTGKTASPECSDRISCADGFIGSITDVYRTRSVCTCNLSDCIFIYDVRIKQYFCKALYWCRGEF